jgi:putative PEP-CTERM system histidine kinase
MDNVGLLSYSISGTAYLFLSALLFAKWRASREAILLVLATCTTAAWAISNAIASLQPNLSSLILIIELCKSSIWGLFLLRLLQKNYPGISRSILGGIITTGSVAILVGLVSVSPLGIIITYADIYYMICVLIISLLGFVLVEQIYRNTSEHNIWAMKFLCLGIGGMFIYDIYLYSSALLFRQFDIVIWSARGVVYAFFVPMIAISAARNPNWSITPFVSRHVVFYSTSILAAGVYMFMIASAGYYIKIFGGSWGAVLQVVFSFGAILALIVIMFSGQAKARLKQLISEHFYSNKYDYRKEWLRLMRVLSTPSDELTIYQRVLKGIAQIVESPAGILWLRKNINHYHLAATWNIDAAEYMVSINDNMFHEYMETHKEVIDLLEYQKHAENYENLTLPSWLISIPRGWLIVPIMHEQKLYGIVLLTRSRAALHHTWEDSELLRTVGQQVASYLAQEEAAKKLAESQQFEAFNRLSAYVVHDLKNVVAQLDLVIANSKKYTDNPEFMRDAIKTIDNAVYKMNQMLTQLRNGRPQITNAAIVKLDNILETVILQRSKDKPVPRLKKKAEGIKVIAEKHRLTSIIEHLVQNAQEANTANGNVTVTLGKQESQAVIEIQDSGCGMDLEFITNRLFKPFDTTKGNAGMGMGAYESRQYVQELGGEITVKSTVGEGTLVTLHLPLSEHNADLVNLRL